MIPALSNGDTIWCAQILVAAFFAILFLQSGLDKVIDRRGNLEYFTGHFANSPLAKTVPLLFVVITILEVSTGIVSAAGALWIYLFADTTVASLGVVLAGVALLSLFFGQRIAKDYAGAAGLVPYFLVVIGGVLVLTQ